MAAFWKYLVGGVAKWGEGESTQALFGVGIGGALGIRRVVGFRMYIYPLFQFIDMAFAIAVYASMVYGSVSDGRRAYGNQYHTTLTLPPSPGLYSIPLHS